MHLCFQMVTIASWDYFFKTNKCVTSLMHILNYCVNASYKLLDLRLPVYLMLCEDSNGQSEIIAVCILVTENAEGIRWMFETFKAQNAKWCDVKVVMSDKDINEREVIKEVFPDASVLICLIHTLRTFRREVTCERMGITSGQKSMCLELVQKLAYCTSQEQ